MTSPRNHGKKPAKHETTQKENNKSPKPSPQKRLNFGNLTGFKLRPIEIIALSMLLLAILVYMFSRSNREPEERQIEQLADTTKLQEKAAQLRPLYVIVDSLKLRATPKIDSNFIRYLAYDEMIYDMGEQTEHTQTIRYSADEVRTEPWVKIRTSQGEVGWVFGAGVGFYRKKQRPAAITTITVPSTTTTTPSTTTTNPSTTTPSTTTTTPSAPITPNTRITTTQPSTTTSTRPSNR